MNAVKNKLCLLIMMMLSCVACGSPRVIVEGFTIYTPAPQERHTIVQPTSTEQNVEQKNAEQHVEQNVVNHDRWGHALAVSTRPSYSVDELLDHRVHSIAIKRYQLHMPEVEGLSPRRAPAFIQGHLTIEEMWVARSLDDGDELIAHYQAP